ncbi:deleted 1 base in 1 codon [Balamuthia mandrillaris]
MRFDLSSIPLHQHSSTSRQLKERVTAHDMSWIPQNRISTDDFDGSFAPHSDYAFFWRLVVDEESGEERLRVAVATRTDGWVGFGISVNGGMKGADIVTLTEPEEGEFKLIDRFSTDFERPKEDDRQDVELLSASRENGVLTFVFERPILSCDEEDFEVPEGLANVLFAFGESGTRADISYHGSNRGTVAVALRPPAGFTFEEFASSSSFDASEVDGWLEVRTEEVAIPASRTNYYCTAITFPNDKKYHAIKIDPIVDSHLVHHMILYSCVAPQDFTAGPCAGAMRTECVNPWALWAVGSPGVIYPENAGLPFGKREIIHTMLEIHYDNPRGEEGLVDRSGFNISYTERLREYDVATFSFGLLPSPFFMSIPPGERDYRISVTCPAACLERYLPEDGITILFNGLHMHNFGSSIRTQHIRQDKELQALADMRYWDFNHQGPQYVYGRKIYPGDYLIHHCNYNTERVSEPVYGGESTSEEMCFNFIQYYPRMDLFACTDISVLAPDMAVCANNNNLTELLNNYVEYMVPIQPNEYEPVVHSCLLGSDSASAVQRPFLSRFFP